ncbi:DUF6520 family protein [Sphingobacterium kitahiroshimense]|uniref:DUF6520 family protein n=1 Tax=Sphingobacterium kitahiroshimense TaxID=470446 RepID=A0ABV0BMX6_9SPHI
MKTLKTKLSLVVVAIIGIITMSFALANNESKEEKVEKKAATTWHYTSNSTTAGAFANAANWQQGAGPSCGSTGNKPCEITVDAENEIELEAYLDGMSNPEVLAINPTSKRN